MRQVQVWSLPDDPSGFRHLLTPQVVDLSTTDRDDTVGSGSLTVPRDYEHKGLIVDADPADVANNRSSLVGVFDSDCENCTPCFEFFASEGVETLHDTGAAYLIKGDGIRSALDDGIIDANPEGDAWVWGGRNLLTNPGFEESNPRPDIQEVWVDATAGTVRASDGVDTVDFDWDETALGIEAAIEAGITSIDVIKVRGAGTEDDPWTFEYVTPPFGNLLLFTDIFLTGDLFVDRTQFGALEPTGWEKSQLRSSGSNLIHGGYDSFRVTTEEADEGTYSLLIDPASIGRRFAGGQQVPNVSGVKRAQARVRMRTVGSSQEYRFRIAGFDEEQLLTETGEALVQQTLTANTWTTLSIPDVLFGNNQQVIFRAANINVSDNPAKFYIDSAVLEEGFAKTTIGEILLALLADLQDRGVLPWLEPGFTETLDGNENAWDSDQISFQADVGTLFGTHVMADVKALGYEWDVRRLVTPHDGFTHELVVTNPGGMSGTSNQAVVVGSIGSGSLAKRRVEKTHVLVESSTGEHVWVTDARFAGLSRREGFHRAEQAADLPTAQRVGEQLLDDDIGNLLAAQVSLTTDTVRAYRDFKLGWTVPYVLAGRAAAHDRRIHSISLRFDGNTWSDEVTASRYFPPDASAGGALMWEALRRLLTEFKRKPRPVRPVATVAGGGGGVPRFVAGAADASELSKSKSDLVADGTNDPDVFAIAVSERGEVRITEGSLEVGEGPFTIVDGVYITGGGWDASRLGIPTGTPLSWVFAGDSGMRFIQVSGPGGT